MEYALPEATIGEKWECVWNGKIMIEFYYILPSLINQLNT